MANSIAFQRLLLNMLKRFDYQEIEGLHEAVRSFSMERERSYKEETQSLDADTFESDVEFEGYKFHLECEMEFLGDIMSLNNELCIVALYKKLEIATRKLLLRFYPTLKPKELSSIDYLKKNLPFDIAKLNGYASADELRNLNNAIKHEGKVTKQLAAYPGWIVGTPFSDLEVVFSRLAPIIEIYIGSLCDEICRDQNLGP